MKRRNSARRQGVRARLDIARWETLEGRLLLAVAPGPSGLIAAYSQHATSSNASRAALLAAAKLATTTTLAADPSTSDTFQPVLFTAVVSDSGAGAGSPTGSVVFEVDGVAQPAVAVVPSESSAGQATARFTFAFEASGPHVVSASYGGDPTFAASSSDPVSERVRAFTFTSLLNAPDPVVQGQPVTFAVVVTSPDEAAGGPRGTVTFSIDGVDQPPVAVVPSATVADQGTASFTTSTLSVGSHFILESYSGTAVARPSSFIGGFVAVQAPTTTVVTTSADPASAGRPVILTAAVAANPSPAGTPIGNVTFLDGTSVLGVVPLGAGGVATLATSSLAAGSHTITAAYDGNVVFTADAGNFAASTGTTTLTVTPLATTPPAVVGLERFGYHLLPTVLVLTFDGPLDPASAQDVRNYRIIDPNGHAIGLLSATYDPATLAVTLRPSRRLNIHHPYHLKVIGTGPAGVVGADGVPLDGSGEGRPGTNYKAVVDRSTLVLPPSFFASHAARPSRTRAAAHPHGPSAAKHHGGK